MAAGIINIKVILQQLASQLTPLRMRGSGNNGSGCGDKNRMRAVDGKQEIYLEWVVYPSYNDIHDIFLSEVSSQRSRH